MTEQKTQETRVDRGITLWSNKRDQMENNSPNVWTVPACSSPEPYIVNIYSTYAACGCPDWTERRKKAKAIGLDVEDLEPCKHIVAVELERVARKMERRKAVR